MKPGRQQGDGDEASKALWARCEKCGHCWAAAYYPVDLQIFAKAAKRHSRCPKCDGRGMVAKQADGVLQETPEERGSDG